MTLHGMVGNQLVFHLQIPRLFQKSYVFLFERDMTYLSTNAWDHSDIHQHILQQQTQAPLLAVNALWSKITTDGFSVWSNVNWSTLTIVSL